MRSRTRLMVFILIVVVVFVLAQNGMLGSLFGATPFPLGRPLVFVTASGNQVLAPSNLPTSYAPAYASQAPPQQPIVPGVTQTLVPSGVAASGGQCIVPSGWVAYTVQAGETLAVIAQRYNLTAEQMAASNCLPNPDLIYEAQVLAVPGTP